MKKTPLRKQIGKPQWRRNLKFTHMAVDLNEEGLVNVSDKKPGSKYSGLCRLHRLCHSYSTLLLYGESHIQYRNK